LQRVDYFLGDGWLDRLHSLLERDSVGAQDCFQVHAAGGHVSALLGVQGVLELFVLVVQRIVQLLELKIPVFARRLKRLVGQGADSCQLMRTLLVLRLLAHPIPRPAEAVRFLRRHLYKLVRRK